METLTQMWARSVEHYPERPVIGVRQSKSVRLESGQTSEEVTFNPVTYLELEEMISQMGRGLIAIGLKEKEAVAIVAENSLRWMISDMAVLANCSYDVPRGCTSTLDELEYILNHSQTKIIFVDDKEQLDRLLSINHVLETVESIIVIDENYNGGDNPSDKFKTYTFDQVMEMGKDLTHKDLFKSRRKKVLPGDVATLMYTSGTTGKPKGIPLTHSNIMHNLNTVPGMVGVTKTDRFLSILPIWHIFERTLDYAVLYSGASLWYTTRMTILKDLSIVNPTFFASVPRIWITIHNNTMAQMRRLGKEGLFHKFFKHSINVIRARRYTKNRQCVFGEEEAKRDEASIKDHIMHKLADFLIYRKIRAKLGTSFIAAISGGGSLPEYIDDFFEVVGIKLLEAYGLTETSPALCSRTFENHVPFTVGKPLPHTLLKIMDTDDGLRELPDGEKGSIWVSGPQVMQGYYKNPEETKKVMRRDDDGRLWFNTGDLGRRNQNGDIKIMGRMKDTIVLIGGENIEPEKIESTITSSPYIEQTMVCGQDQENLTALIVPDMDLLKGKCEELGIKLDKKDLHKLNSNKELTKFYMDVIQESVSMNKGFKELELIRNVALTSPFTIENSTLTNTMKVKRHKVEKRDCGLIKGMYPRFNQIRKECGKDLQ